MHCAYSPIVVAILIAGAATATPAAADDSDVWDLSRRGQETIDAKIQSGHAYRSCDPALQEVIRSIAQLADEYVDATENELRAIPGERDVTYVNGGRLVKYTVTQPDGVTKAFSYDRDLNELMSVSITQPDKSRVSAFFTTYTTEDSVESRGLSELIKAMPGGYPKTEIFVNRNMEITGVMNVVAGEWPDYVVQGKMMWWDPHGNLVVDLDIEEPMAYDDVMCLYTPEQLDALRVSAMARLRTSKAFKGLPFELQRPIENVVGWSERFADARPEDLATLAHGHEMTQADAGDAIVYRVATDDGREWVFAYDKSTARPKSARRGELAIYFDYHDTGKVIGGSGTYTEHLQGEDGVRAPIHHYWCFSIHPVEVAPRMVIGVTANTPTESGLAIGRALVWDTKGEVIVDKDIPAPTPLAEAIALLSNTLTPEQKGAIAWRGPQEIDYLLGEF